MLALLVLVGIQSAICTGDDKKPTSTLQPIMSFSGGRSKIATARLLKLTNEKDWQLIWNEHKTGQPRPQKPIEDGELLELDFKKVMAIAVFGGKVDVERYSVDSVLEGEASLTVRIKAHSFQTALDTPDSNLTPWGFFMIPASDKEVRIHRDARTLIDDPPRWIEWKRFPKNSTGKK